MSHIITKPVYLHEVNGQHAVFAMDMSGCGYTPIAASEASFEIDDDAALQARMADIDRRIDVVQDEYATKMRRLNNEKSKLLCLENEVSE